MAMENSRSVNVGATDASVGTSGVANVESFSFAKYENMQESLRLVRVVRGKPGDRARVEKTHDRDSKSMYKSQSMDGKRSVWFACS